MRALIVPIGAERYVVPLDAVREVVAAPVIGAVPTAPQTVRGLINLRGDIVPVLDTSVLLGGPPLDGVRFAAVVSSARGLAALASDGEPATTTLAEPLASEGGCTRYRIDGGLAAPADIDTLLDAVGS